jgi:hypothetical protein
MKKTITNFDDYFNNKTKDERGADCYSATTSAHTERTSLGKSVRGQYKSYSEKFLAEQEDIKRRCLVAIMEGRSLSDVGVGGMLLLTDGRSTLTSAPKLSSSSSSSTKSWSPVDPDADIVVERESNGSSVGSQANVIAPYRDVNDDDACTNAFGSGRRGVYGGGIRYFTPDNSFYRSEGGTGSELTELEESEEEEYEKGLDGEGCAPEEEEMEIEEHH